MARIKTFSRSLLVAALMAYAAPALAADDGYAGLFAPTHPSTAPVPPPAPVAVTPPPVAGPAAAAATPTYSGLLTSPAPQQSLPSYMAPSGVINDLGLASAVYGSQNAIQLPGIDYSGVKHHKINGKSAMSFTIEQQVKTAMASINNKDLSSAERDDAAKKAYDNLSRLANGMRRKQLVPDSTYKSMNLSDDYIKEERANNDDALMQLEAALDELKPYQ